MRKVSVLVLLFITFSGAIGHAQDYADWIGSVPQRLKTLRLGMPLSEVQKVIPEAMSIDAAAVAAVAPTPFFVFFKAPEVWESASLSFSAGKLVAIDLMLIHRAPDSLARAQERLADVLATNGTAYTRLITLNSAKEPIPAYVWEKGDFVLFAQGPSAGTSRSGKQVFAVDPQLRVGVAPKTRPMSGMVAVASPGQMIDFLFTLLSPVEKK